jgi:ABC-type transport system involved in cytochrome bd biosynthesis fused ATPase/permease subunit
MGKSSAGKSSLLYAILGEMEKISKSTRIVRNGKTTFMGQSQWTIGDTIKENILMGRREDNLRLEKVIKMAQMERDVDCMPLGMETMVGDTGHTISGGQRARLALARSFYQE